MISSGERSLCLVLKLMRHAMRGATMGRYKRRKGQTSRYCRDRRLKTTKDRLGGHETVKLSMYLQQQLGAQQVLPLLRLFQQGLFTGQHGLQVCS